jgi:hypothetical protein
MSSENKYLEMTKTELDAVFLDQVNQYSTLMEKELVRSEQLIEEMKSLRQSLLLLRALMRHIPEVLDARIKSIDKVLTSRTRVS